VKVYICFTYVSISKDYSNLNTNLWYLFLYSLFYALINTAFVCKILVSKVRSTNQSWVNSLVDVARPYRLSVGVHYKEFLKSVVLSFLVPVIAIVIYLVIFKYSYRSEAVDSWVVSLASILLSISLVSSAILYVYPFSEYRVRVALGFFFVIIFVFMLSTPISVKISAKALEFLNVGGGVTRVYYVEKRNKSKLPGESINDNCCVDSFCFTNKLSIIWGVGDLVYVDVRSKKHSPIKQHIAIPRNILISYELDEPLPDVCKIEEEQKIVEDKGRKEQI